jgi:NADH-quinone oxidoreductase subunit L
VLLLIPLLPLAGFVLNAAFGRRLTKAISGGVACAAMAGAFVVSALAVWRLVALPADARELTDSVFTWIGSGDFKAEFALRLDPLASLMILVVTGIGTLIHVYSTAYMHEETDAEFARYFSYLNLFAAFMLVLVLGSSFLSMFVGWEGVGLCSYLLIGFWYEKPAASEAGKKAFIVNRVGDVGFVLGVLLVWTTFGTIEFDEVARRVAALPPEATFGVVSLITLLLFVGATGKSAQIPLYVWLPDAMEGPTPVSALIHAATMVTAGVYMIGRNAVLFSHAPPTLGAVAVAGTATALLAGTIGLVQNDIKRVLAYSTVSQLGYMFMAMGVGAYAAGIFHLYTHAFFKALLFLGSGAIIHALGGEQDLRRMGGLRRQLPVTYGTFLVGALAIAGVPLLSGFFSKDEILFKVFSGGHIVLWTVGLVTSLLTAIYMFRLVFLVFHGEPRGGEAAVDAGGSGHQVPAAGADATRPAAGHGGHGHGPGGHARVHDAPPAMAAALLVLALGSVVAGYVGVPHAVGGANRIEGYLAPSFGEADPAAAGAHGGGHAPSAGASTELALMGVSSIVALAGIGAAFFLFVSRRDAADALAARFARLHRLLARKYYVDELYDAAIVQPVRRGSEAGLWRAVDIGIIDGLVNGVAAQVSGAGDRLRRTQTGSVRVYAASLFCGVVVVVGYFLWP